MKLTA